MNVVESLPSKVSLGLCVRLWIFGSSLYSLANFVFYLVALSVLGLFWVIVDKYNFVSKRSSVYELAEQGETIAEKH